MAFQNAAVALETPARYQDPSQSKRKPQRLEMGPGAALEERRRPAFLFPPEQAVRLTRWSLWPQENRNASPINSHSAGISAASCLESAPSAGTVPNLQGDERRPDRVARLDLIPPRVRNPSAATCDRSKRFFIRRQQRSLTRAASGVTRSQSPLRTLHGPAGRPFFLFATIRGRKKGEGWLERETTILGSAWRENERGRRRQIVYIGMKVGLLVSKLLDRPLIEAKPLTIKVGRTYQGGFSTQSRVPFIRMAGRWLTEAGFMEGDVLQVTVVQGEIRLTQMSRSI